MMNLSSLGCVWQLLISMESHWKSIMIDKKERILTAPKGWPKSSKYSIEMDFECPILEKNELN